MSRNIAKPFKTTLSSINIDTIKPKYRCFYGEDVELYINVVDESNEALDLSDTSCKVYFIAASGGELKQENNIQITDAHKGMIQVRVNKRYIQLGLNTVRVVIFDSDQEVYLQPFEIMCMSTGITGQDSVLTPDNISSVEEELKKKQIQIDSLKIADIDIKNEIDSVEEVLKEHIENHPKTEVDLTGYQNKSDYELQTTSKNVVGSINEVNGIIIDHLNNHPSGGGGDASVDLSDYQKKSDSRLETTSKNIVDAINENKNTVNDMYNVFLRPNVNGLKCKKTSIVEAININYDNVLSLANTMHNDFQKKSDSRLETTSKNIVDAINENKNTFNDMYNVFLRPNVNGLNCKETSIIKAININYDKILSQANTMHNDFQKKSDSMLDTTNKTVIGAINEVHTLLHEHIGNHPSGGGNTAVDLSSYQKKTDDTLLTESKDIVGSINELYDVLSYLIQELPGMSPSDPEKTPIDVTFESGWALNDSLNNSFIKINGEIILRGILKSGVVTDGTKIASIHGFTPMGEVVTYQHFTDGDGNIGVARVKIDELGDIFISKMSGKTTEEFELNIRYSE